MRLCLQAHAALPVDFPRASVEKSVFSPRKVLVGKLEYGSVKTTEQDGKTEEGGRWSLLSLRLLFVSSAHKLLFLKAC